MIVGYMRKGAKPKKLPTIIAKMCSYYDLQLVHFTPQDVDIENNTINGMVLKNGKWVNQVTPIPKFIDMSIHCYKNIVVVNYLEKRSILSNYRLGPKNVVYKKLYDDGEFAHLIIPNINIGRFYDLKEFIDKYNKIIIKPKSGGKGKGIYSIEKVQRKYLLSDHNTEQLMNEKKLNKYLDENIKYDNYLAQKYINSQTPDGKPFDCRVRLEKNGKGMWEVAFYLVRISSSSKITSNVSQGGSVSRLKPFLKMYFPDKWEKILKEIKTTSLALPYKLENLFNKRLSSVGIDIGIDTDGSIYFFENNTAAGSMFGLGEVASLRVEHYNYIINKINEE